MVNAGSSSVKFQIFELATGGVLRRLVKGQMDGIGTRPHLRAATPEGSSLVDKRILPEKYPTSQQPSALLQTGCANINASNCWPSDTVWSTVGPYTTDRLSSIKRS